MDARTSDCELLSFLGVSNMRAEQVRSHIRIPGGIMRKLFNRLVFVTAAAVALLMLAIGPAEAITIQQCEEAGGVVIRCAEQPVTRNDKVTCPAPGKTIRLWCVGTRFYTMPDGSPMEVFDSGGDSKYRR